MKNFLLLLVIAVCGFIGFEFLNSDPEKDAKRIAMVQEVVNKPIESAEDKAILAALTIGSSLASKQLEGKEINSQTKFVSLTVGPGRKLNFVVQRVDLEDGFFVYIKNDKRQDLVKSFCSNQFIGKVIDSGYAASIEIVDKNKKPLTTVNIIKSDCN